MIKHYGYPREFKKSKRFEPPEFDKFQKKNFDLNNETTIKLLNENFSKLNDELDEIKSKNMQTDIEKIREKNIKVKLRQITKKINNPYSIEYKGEGCGVAKKIANLLVRIYRKNNLAIYKLICLDDIDIKAYEFGFLDSKYHFNYEFQSLDEINEAFKIYIDCND